VKLFALQIRDTFAVSPDCNPTLTQVQAEQAVARSSALPGCSAHDKNLSRKTHPTVCGVFI